MRRSQAFGLAAAAAAALVFTAAAGGKDFRPGDLRVCNARTCVAITDQQVLDQLSAFYYGSSPPARTRAPRPGVPFFQLRFPNGYVTGIVSTSRLDRFLSYGVNLEQFRRGR